MAEATDAYRQALAVPREMGERYPPCYRVLQAKHDARAHQILSAAQGLLHERAGTIEDGDLRRSYLEKVAVHREILARVPSVPPNGARPLPAR